MLLVSLVDAGKIVSNRRFPYLFIHVKASQAAGKGTLGNTRNWSHHQNPGIKISRVRGFKNVWGISGILTADNPISLHTTSIHVFSVEITCDCSSTTYLYMSLFQFGFSLRREESSAEDSVKVKIVEPQGAHTIGCVADCVGFPVVEHRKTAAAVVNLSRPAQISQQKSTS